VANIWVLYENVAPHEEPKGPTDKKTARLIRADVITHVDASVGVEVVVADGTAQEPLVVARARGGMLLPDRFHFQLMAKLSDLRREAPDYDNDQVVVAQQVEGKWIWAQYNFKEL